ncbi:MAG: protease pro-enzyme activation domain-containing protein [Actinomycetota bacterium]
MDFPARSYRSALAVLLLLPVVAAVSAGADPARTVRLDASTVPWARASNVLRTAPAAERISFDVYLRLRDGDAAERLAYAVSDPASPAYRRFVLPERFRARFSPTVAAAQRVADWLRAQGFSVDAVAENRTIVEASGAVSQTERAFGVDLNEYRVGGSVLRAPASAPEIPAALGPSVLGVGLQESSRRPSSAPSAEPPDALHVGSPCSKYWGEEIARNKPKAYGHTLPFTPCGYTPRQMQGAYGVAGAIANGNDGRGTTIAILDAFHSPTAAKDLRIYSRRNELPKARYSEVLQRCPCPGARWEKQLWSQEQSLDLDAAHTMAPRAHLLYVGTRTSGDANFLRMTNRIVDEDLADVISNSSNDVGEDISASLLEAQHQVYVQAAAEGISVLNSSFDYGDDLAYFGSRAVNWPASDPLVTAVGGTSLAIGAERNYLFETGWGTTTSTLVHGEWRPDPPGEFLGGGGGGTSRLYDEPPYQRGVVPPALAQERGGANRVVPDIALDGDPNTGFRFGQTVTFPNGDVRYSEYRFGGTSLSTPLLAGIEALAIQRGGERLGLLNPALYRLAGTRAFRDVVDPPRTVAVVRTGFNNGLDARGERTFYLRTMNQTGTLDTTRGYDNVTGLGSPRGHRFIQALAG